MILQVKYLEGRLNYTGRELSPHFILEHYSLHGSALVAARGGCDVPTAHLVDWEDRLANDRIGAGEMLHFLGEFFERPLREGVWIQRQLVALAGEILRNSWHCPVVRTGDDLWVADRKLTVSIVAPTLASCVLHLGMNIDPSGAPVPAIGLAELKVDPERFAHQLLEAFQEEWSSVVAATHKVRGVTGRS